ncbi:hypothetical protein PTKIN_Ptkin03bG0123600 [Pterospermum kingtungense]
MEILDFAMDSLPIWVQLSNIPLELLHQKRIGCIASAIEIKVVLKSGKVVKVQVSIPWLPAKCMQCKVFGHRDKNCLKKAAVEGKQWVPKQKAVGADNGLNKVGAEIENGQTMDIQTSLSGKENGRASFTHQFALLQLDKETEVVKELEKEVGTVSSKSSTFSSVAESMKNCKVSKESSNKEVS